MNNNLFLNSASSINITEIWSHEAFLPHFFYMNWNSVDVFSGTNNPIRNIFCKQFLDFRCDRWRWNRRQLLRQIWICVQTVCWVRFCFLCVVQDCDKFQSKSLVSPTALVSALSGCLHMMEPWNAVHRTLPWDTRRTRCRLSSGEHLKINNINDDFSLLVTSVCALRSDAIMLAGLQSPPPPSETCLSC